MKRRAYERYITSAHWRARKDRYFRAHEKRCAACQSEDRIDLHHLSYEFMGREPDGDLMPLCQICHTLVHEHHRVVGGSLRDATHHVVCSIGCERSGPRNPIRRKLKKRKARTAWDSQVVHLRSVSEGAGR